MSVVTVTLKSNGRPINQPYQLTYVDVTKEYNRIPYAQLIIVDGDAALQTFEISNKEDFAPGSEIEILIRYEGKPPDKAVFKGRVAKHSVQADASGSLLTIELKDDAFKLTRQRNTSVFHKRSDKQIIEEILREQGFRSPTGVGTLANTQPSHKEIIQYYCTDWDFILSRAEMNGLLVEVNDGKISVEPPKLTGAPVHTFDFGRSEIYSFDMEVDTSEAFKDVKATGWDIAQQKIDQAQNAAAFSLRQGEMKNDSEIGKVGKKWGMKTQELVNPVSLDPKEMKAWATGQMVKNRLSILKGRISVKGDADIKVGQVIQIKGIGDRFNGHTLITAVRHQVSIDGWHTEIQFGLSKEWFIQAPDIAAIPAAGMLPPVHGLQIGTVDKFEEDRDGPYRVKVRLASMPKDTDGIWARQAQLYAGEGRGFFFRPEVGDEVIVGFFNDDPRQAVILGSMYSPGKHKIPDNVSLGKDNDSKAIVSRSGAALAFLDEEKPRIGLITPNDNMITLDDDGEMIQLTDQHGNSITMNKDGIQIKSDKKILIEAKGDNIRKGANLKDD